MKLLTFVLTKNELPIYAQGRIKYKTTEGYLWWKKDVVKYEAVYKWYNYPWTFVGCKSCNVNAKLSAQIDRELSIILHDLEEKKRAQQTKVIVK